MPKRSPIRLLLVVLGRAFVCLIMLVIAGAIVGQLVRSKPVPKRSERADEAIRVPVMLARAVEVSPQWTGYGTAAALDSVDVPTRVTATVVHIPPTVVEGARIEQGGLLARLDDSDFANRAEVARQSITDIEAQLERWDIERKEKQERIQLARQQVQLAEAELERVVQAEARGGALPRDLDQARQALITTADALARLTGEFDAMIPRRSSTLAQKAGLEADLRIARENVERSRITSPIAGVIETVDIELGEGLTAGQRIARVVDPAQVEVPLRLPSRARRDVSVGDAMRLRTSFPGGPRWTASVTRIAPVDDERTRTMTVYVDLSFDDDTRHWLAPGTFVEGTVTSRASRLRTVVPRRSLVGDRVYLVEDGVIVGRSIEVETQVEQAFPQFGLPDRAWVALATPLPDGAALVVAPTRNLADGRTAVAIPVGTATVIEGLGPGGAAEARP